MTDPDDDLSSVAEPGSLDPGTKAEPDSDLVGVARAAGDSRSGYASADGR